MSEHDEAAGGLEAVAHSVRHAFRAGLSRALPALRVVNQPEGFDCPGCAWPEAAEHGRVEFCENGAKAVAHEATTRSIGREFFASWPVAQLRAQPHRWLEAQGRLAEPLRLRPGGHHFEPISWSEALERAGSALRALASPDQAVFYTSGRTSNEAAFLYQLFVREYGTNNLPDCSNLCHESSGTGLGEMIGIGKGTVSLADFALADLILVIGQNPGSNHPRMLTTLQAAARRGCRIVSVNPLRERGLVRFRHPQEASGLLGRGTELASHFVRVRVGGMPEIVQTGETGILADPGSVDALAAALIDMVDDPQRARRWIPQLRYRWRRRRARCRVQDHRGLAVARRRACDRRARLAGREAVRRRLVEGRQHALSTSADRPRARPFRR